ncbi:hypothetical protein SESBI_46423 [Sesbania bispinosa]|nr:hypothetical protein SESBI_46423 [Sesbania bispinosa]
MNIELSRPVDQGDRMKPRISEKAYAPQGLLGLGVGDIMITTYKWDKKYSN